jgi:hypothetical protein
LDLGDLLVDAGFQAMGPLGELVVGRLELNDSRTTA